MVLLVLDALRRDRLSLYNDEVEFTEHLDAIGEGSLVFDDVIAQASWTRRQGANVAQTDRVLSSGQSFVRDSETKCPVLLHRNLLDAHEHYYPQPEYRERFAPSVDPRNQCQIPSRHLKVECDADFDTIGQLYDASVAYMDDAIGEFIEFLRATELLDDTVMVIISEHG